MVMEYGWIMLECGEYSVVYGFLNCLWYSVVYR